VNNSSDEDLFFEGGQHDFVIGVKVTKDEVLFNQEQAQIGRVLDAGVQSFNQQIEDYQNDQIVLEEQEEDLFRDEAQKKQEDKCQIINKEDMENHQNSELLSSVQIIKECIENEQINDSYTPDLGEIGRSNKELSGVDDVHNSQEEDLFEPTEEDVFSQSIQLKSQVTEATGINRQNISEDKEDVYEMAHSIEEIKEITLDMQYENHQVEEDLFNDEQNSTSNENKQIIADEEDLFGSQSIVGKVTQVNENQDLFEINNKTLSQENILVAVQLGTDQIKKVTEGESIETNQIVEDEENLFKDAHIGLNKNNFISNGDTEIIVTQTKIDSNKQMSEDEEDLFDTSPMIEASYHHIVEEEVKNVAPPVIQSNQQESEEEEDLFHTSVVLDPVQAKISEDEEDLFGDDHKPADIAISSSSSSSSDLFLKKKKDKNPPSSTSNSVISQKNQRSLNITNQLISRFSGKRKRVVKIDESHKPNFLQKIEDIGLDDALFEKMRVIDKLAIKGDADSLDEESVAFFQYFRKCLLQLFVDTDYCQQYNIV